MICKALYRTLTTEQHESHKKWGEPMSSERVSCLFTALITRLVKNPNYHTITTTMVPKLIRYWTKDKTLDSAPILKSKILFHKTLIQNKFRDSFCLCLCSCSCGRHLRLDADDVQSYTVNYIRYIHLTHKNIHVLWNTYRYGMRYNMC
jgi:hypothetical protein